MGQLPLETMKYVEAALESQKKQAPKRPFPTFLFTLTALAAGIGLGVNHPVWLPYVVPFLETL